MTEIEYTGPAIDHLENLDQQVADRVMNEVDEATAWTDQRPGLLANFPCYKLRVGDYRAIITLDEDDNLLGFEAEQHRVLLERSEETTREDRRDVLDRVDVDTE